MKEFAAAALAVFAISTAMAQEQAANTEDALASQSPPPPPPRRNDHGLRWMER